MITGNIKSQIDQIWNAFWSGGIANPLEVIEQITFLLFLRRLDDLQMLEENKSARLKRPMERRAFPEGVDVKGRPYDDLRWSRFRHFAPALKARPSVEDLADIIDNPVQSREAFEKTSADDFAGERAMVTFLEAAHPALDDLTGDELSNRYFNLLAEFVDKFSLRYDLRRPCTLCPTLTGMFANLLRNVNGLALADGNVAKRLKDVQEAVQDLRLGQTEGRISNCVAKQVILLEAIGATAVGVTGSELAAICNQSRQWPHPAMKNSLLNLYGFASDFPGLRHGTPSTGMLRDIDMRDLVAVSILLAGFTPYLSDQLDGTTIYRGN